MDSTTSIINPQYHGMFIQALLAFLGMFLVAWYTNWQNKKINNHEKRKEAVKEALADISVELDDKVDKEDCTDTMRRVGKQVDKLDTEQGILSKKVNGHDVSLRGLEVGMEFMVKSAGGNYKALKNGDS